MENRNPHSVSVVRRARPWPVLALILVLMSPVPGRAQGEVRAWGMGGLHAAGARGLETVSANPANLAFCTGTNVGLATAAADVHNNAISLDRYNQVTGSYLDAADKAALLADIPDAGLRLDADVHASVLGVQQGPFALSFGALGQGQGNLDKSYFDLVLQGNSLGQTVDFDNTWGEGYALAAATVSYGRRVAGGADTPLGLGMNLHYYQGLYEMHVEDAHGNLTTGLSEISGDAYLSALTAEGGQGYGVDLGLALQIRGWQWGLALDNAVTTVNWTRNTRRRAYRVTAADINLMNSNLGDAVADQDTTYDIGSYTTTLPRRLRLGFATARGPLALAGDYVQGLEDRGVTSTRPQLNAGVEWRLTGWVQPRLGAAVGGAAGSSYSAGLGLAMGFWRVDVAARSRGGMAGAGTKGAAFAVGSSLQF